ncbi:acetyl-CoA hydrolase/transferase C-terminal domain-containing protein [Sorangium sp. So ce381]|uniref:acetyl-CoA hydrolase/transferase C-terminal domain-containing protein n=1 Tax=Sorangium sp. So ce381 TaxID=3133307 RepID=UPI003F5AE277
MSRIQPAFEQGAGIVTSRGDVHYAVTEHGVADLWGRNIRQRALALPDRAKRDSPRSSQRCSHEALRPLGANRRCGMSAPCWSRRGPDGARALAALHGGALTGRAT